MVEYKVVELTTVTDEQIEKTINEWIPRGWHFDQLCFAMTEASKRPAMAFVMFTREVDNKSEESV